MTTIIAIPNRMGKPMKNVFAYSCGVPSPKFTFAANVYIPIKYPDILTVCETGDSLFSNVRRSREESARTF